MENNTAHPVRRHLPHTPPPCVSRYTVGAPYFITVCVSRAHYGIAAEDAGRTGPLTSAPIAEAIVEALEYRRQTSRMTPFIAVVMPDHVHFIATFSPESSMPLAVRGIKRFVAARHGVVWQTGFFDHRLRHDQEFAETWHYICENPVAKGLCAKADDWPYRRIWENRGGW